jgi:hypothetical protein
MALESLAQRGFLYTRLTPSLVDSVLCSVARKKNRLMNSCWADTDVIKSNLRARYRQKVKNEAPDNGACDLPFIIIDVLLEFTGEMPEE